MLGQHVWTTFHLFQSFTPLLVKSRSGRVIVVSASTVPNPPGKTGVYTAAKAAQENMVLTLAAELKEQGVTANIIQVRAIDVGNTGKGTTPDEIVAAMQYLFSEEAAKVSGARIPAILKSRLPGSSRTRKSFISIDGCYGCAISNQFTSTVMGRTLRDEMLKPTNPSLNP